MAIMGCTHFFDHGNGRTTLFTPDNCENCNGPIQAANAVGGSSDDIRTYKAMGMKQSTTLPCEGYYSDKTQGEACDDCNG